MGVWHRQNTKGICVYWSELWIDWNQNICKIENEQKKQQAFKKYFYFLYTSAYFPLVFSIFIHNIKNYLFFHRLKLKIEHVGFVCEVKKKKMREKLAKLLRK